MIATNGESSSCFHKMEILLQVSLLPSQTGHCMQAVRQKLNNLLFVYDEALQGIPLSYSDLEFPKGKEYGRIFTEHPHVHVDIITSMIVFKPTIGARITGKVVKMTDNHVSLLVLSLFNASLSSDEMHKFYSYDYTLKTWSSSTRELNENDEVTFEIASFQHSNGVINIDGTLLEG